MALRDRLRRGRFVILGEFEPPKGSDFSTLLNHANQVRGRVDAIVVPEMANAVMKASSLGACAVFREHGIETVLQVCCRDRNRLALQADLLAAGALGIPSVMGVAGEEISHGDHPQARTVNDLDLVELLEVIRKLAGGRDMAGIELRGAPGFLVGSTVDSSATGGLLEIEMDSLEKKIASGVEFVVTRPVFDLHLFKQFLRRIDTGKVAVIATVLLLKSAGMARYIDRNVKGVSIPSDLIRGIQKAPDKVDECIRIAADTVRHLKDMGLAGVLVSTLGWEDRLPRVLDRVGG
jgi:methylenetetrahydrofolate reductase (NADPH)